MGLGYGCLPPLAALHLAATTQAAKKIPPLCAIFTLFSSPFTYNLTMLVVLPRQQYA
jgi:hypothetical protein